MTFSAGAVRTWSPSYDILFQFAFGTGGNVLYARNTTIQQSALTAPADNQNRTDVIFWSTTNAGAAVPALLKIPIAKGEGIVVTVAAAGTVFIFYDIVEVPAE